MRDPSPKLVYLHGELPPIEAQVLGEHWIDAKSDPVPLAEEARAWGPCYASLQEQLIERVTQEVVRQGGSCAQIFDESIVKKHDHDKGLCWLEGKFDYLLMTDSEADAL